MVIFMEPPSEGARASGRRAARAARAAGRGTCSGPPCASGSGRHSSSTPRCWEIACRVEPRPCLVVRREQSSNSVCPSRSASSSRIVRRVGSARALKTSPTATMIGKWLLACQPEARSAARSPRQARVSGVSAPSRRSRSLSSFQAPTEARSSGRPGRLRTTTPASREAVARGLGVGVLPGDERAVAARGDGVAGLLQPLRPAPRPARGRGRAPRRSRGARAPPARRATAPRPRARTTACRSGGRRACRATRARAWCPRRRCSWGRSAGSARASGGDVEHPGAVAAAQPLLAGGRVGGAVERGHVDRDGAGALRAVEDHGHVDLRELLRRELAGDPPDVRADHERGGGADRVRELGERDEPDRRAAVARGLQRPDHARVLLVGGDDLVARARGPSRPSPRRCPRSWRSSARRPRPRRPSRAHSPRAAAPGARSGARSAASRGPRRARPRARPAPNRTAAAAQRPVRPRVQVRDPFEDRELGAEGGGVHPRHPTPEPHLLPADGPGRGALTARRVSRRACPARPRGRRPDCRCRRRMPKSLA